MNRISDLTRRLWAALLALCLVLTLTLPISWPLNHFTMPRETVMPAISTPHPNIMKPMAANLAEAGMPR